MAKQFAFSKQPAYILHTVLLHMNNMTIARSAIIEWLSHVHYDVSGSE